MSEPSSSLPVQHLHSRILIVDDEEPIRQFIARLLTGEGYDCTVAASSEEALALVEEQTFELLILDIMMPGMSGISLLQLVKEHFPETAVIMITAVDNREVAFRTLNLGAYGYVIKPFDRNELIINVVNALERRALVVESRDYENRLEKEVRKRTKELVKKDTELEKAYAKLKRTHAQILQQEKMAAIGQLAAGVAHEINNPTGFIASNLGTLTNYVTKLTSFVDSVSQVIAEKGSEDLLADVDALRGKGKIGFVLTDIKELIDESLEGTERIKSIVQGLKNFSRADQDERRLADINQCIESTINIVWNELKYKVELVKDLGELPRINCYPQQLNQVFMNLLVNASHAIEKQGTITVKTWQQDRNIHISVTDTGSGIDTENTSRVFEPFFTTKEVGKGTGLGLSIAHEIISNHDGTIQVESTPGQGTTFTIVLPVEAFEDRSEHSVESP